MAQVMYVSRGFAWSASEPVMLLLRGMYAPFGVPSAMTKYPWEANSPMAASFDNPA
jgi:hypothetical protein